MSNPDQPGRLRRAFRSGDTRDVFDQAIAAGWTAKRLGSGHVRLLPPKPGIEPVILSTTSSGGRAASNDLATFQRRLREMGE